MSLLSVNAKTRAIRAALVSIAKFKASHPAGMDYSEARPIDYGYLKQHWHSDCSGSIASFYKAAGAQDPAHEGYQGAGNTASFLTNLPHIGKTSCRRGDIVVFNADRPVSTQHAVMLLASPFLVRDPLVWSHGTQGGPFVHPLSYEAGGFSGHTAYLRGVARKS